ncbi:hypothetical protein CARUB_v10016009mg [Capsella rubella]|uniref:Myb/SANT-like domain-containing protein n=1 Tax=Capsella rubella TaxID=81985 RepID=R0GAH0_9BRAS|nr:L10-interacting MYB domain-containing protein [Capsella rubella]EOA32707.1 hypothetical protein CARUB_v10016009mg [Capsella rubella]
MTSGAAWNPEHHKVFVDLCVVQKISNSPLGMEHMLERFQERTGVSFSMEDLTNHWDTMVKQWTVWSRLIECQDMKWDPKTNTFGASEQEWANYLQVNPEAGEYRCNPPSFHKELDIIFSVSYLDGEGTSGGSSQRMQICKPLDENNDTSGVEATLPVSNVPVAATRRPPPRTHRSKWSSTTHAVFIDFCYKEYLKGNTPTKFHGAYSKETWQMMLETVNRSAKGVGYTLTQIKNHWEVIRRKWKLWCQLIESPSMKWDPITRKFGATDEDWDNFLKGHGKAAPFKRKNMAHADKLATIFKGRIEPGFFIARPHDKRVTDHDHEPTQPAAVQTNNIAEDDDDDDDDDDGREPTPLIRSDSEEADYAMIMECQKYATGQVEIVPVKKEYSIEKCMEYLNAMEEVEKGSELYMFALDLFLTKMYREIFVLLETSSLRMTWLLRRQSTGTAA